MKTAPWMQPTLTVYPAFGSPQYDNEYTFNGESYNPNIHSQYLRARYYDTVKGSFLTEASYLGDIRNPLTLNRYSYCIGNPLFYSDPSGQFANPPTNPVPGPNPIPDLISVSDVDWLIYGEMNSERVDVVIAEMKKIGKEIKRRCNSFFAGWDAVPETDTFSKSSIPSRQPAPTRSVRASFRDSGLGIGASIGMDVPILHEGADEFPVDAASGIIHNLFDL